MYLTEQEIMEQHIALEKTYGYFMKKRDEAEGFFRKFPGRRFVFLGCGSSYMLAKSGQRLFAACPDTAASAIAGGDYLVNGSYYRETVKDSIIVTLSRSGQTTEIVRSVKAIKETYGNPVISISMKQDNDLMPYSDLDLTMEWCYDKSVCQTRTVSNLYTALLMLSAFYSQDEGLLASVEQAVQGNQAYKEEYRPLLRDIAAYDWDNAVILADGAVEGIAEEGALAFTEISMLTGKYFHMLDYRHGPMVLNNKKTLNIMLIQPEAGQLQRDMAKELLDRGGILVTVSGEKENVYGSHAHICVGDIDRFEAWGIPFIYVMQMTAYSKSILLGRNPDQPVGLDAFITLK